MITFDDIKSGLSEYGYVLRDVCSSSARYKVSHPECRVVYEFSRLVEVISFFKGIEAYKRLVDKRNSTN